MNTKSTALEFMLLVILEQNQVHLFASHVSLQMALAVIGILTNLMKFPMTFLEENTAIYFFQLLFYQHQYTDELQCLFEVLSSLVTGTLQTFPIKIVLVHSFRISFTKIDQKFQFQIAFFQEFFLAYHYNIFKVTKGIMISHFAR